MQKNLFQDIRPITREPRKPSLLSQASRPLQPLPREVPFEPMQPERGSRYGIWYIAVICIVAFLFSLSFLFEHASVTIVPKSFPVTFDASDTFTAIKDGTDPDTIVYTEMALSGDESVKLPSTQTKAQSLPAAGQVILYNAYTTAPYKLVKGTRLATADGEIYRLNSAASIPGYTKAGTTVVPGTVDAAVTADVAGEAGNIDQSDFSLPGLAKTPQAAKIYARTKTPIAGGVSGTTFSIQQDAANAAYGTLQDKLKNSLIAKAKVQIPDGYIFFDGATIFKTADTVTVPSSKTNDVPVALHGTLTAYLIKEDTLVTAIAEKSISQYNGEAVSIPKLADMTLSPTMTLTPGGDPSFTFSLAGSATVVWTIDSNAIKALLVSTKKSNFENLLGDEVGVDRAQVVLKPFWKQSFPSDPSRIGVTVSSPAQ